MKVLSACTMFVALSLLTLGTAFGQTLTSDQSDYPPGSTATLTGAGFTADELITLQVLHADGTPSTGADHQPWTVVADGNGGFVTTWHVCEDDCIGKTLIATAVGASGASASVQFTDASGTGVVTVTGIGGSCVVGTPPSGGGPFNWDVVQGGSYTMTITGVTECSGGTIMVFVQSTNTGNFCFNATGGSGTYTGTFTMPNPGCFTYPISYKCGANAPCVNTPSNTFSAKGPGGATAVHLRASTFNGSCVKTGNDEICAGCSTPPPGGSAGSSATRACG